jgi:hypothetical protein
MSGGKRYYLANLPAKTDLRILAATIKARWICEQAHQQLKEEQELDHFEGSILARSASSCAHDNNRLRLPPAWPTHNSKTEKRINGPRLNAGHPRTHRLAATATMPALPKMDLQGTAT